MQNKSTTWIQGSTESGVGYYSEVIDLNRQMNDQSLKTWETPQEENKESGFKL